MLKIALRDLANWQRKKTEQVFKVSSPCLDDHHVKEVKTEHLVARTFFLSLVAWRMLEYI